MRADDRVHGTGLDAQRATDARRFVDAGDEQRPRHSARRVERWCVATHELRESRDRRIAAGRTAVDAGSAIGDRLRVRTTARVAATRALRLRQQVVDAIGQIGRVRHASAILATGWPPAGMPPVRIRDFV